VAPSRDRFDQDIAYAAGTPVADPARVVEPETARGRFQHDVARQGKLYEFF